VLRGYEWPRVWFEVPVLRIFKSTILIFVALAAIAPLVSSAQDDANEIPLGDVARNVRKKTDPAQDVIDNDNLSQAMDEVASKRARGASLKFLMAGEGSGFHVSAPDVTCSLSFSANTRALLSSQYAQMDLPPADVLKLRGPATIEGDAITIPVFNGTDWHVSEVAIALTIVKKREATDALGLADIAGGVPMTESEVRPEKKPDVTLIYRMRAAAAPFATTVFSAPLSLELAAGDEWHWAIVQAKGYPPLSYAGSLQPTVTSQPSPVLPPSVPASLLPENAPSAWLAQDAQ
jgi:hypothetical protein